MKTSSSIYEFTVYPNPAKNSCFTETNIEYEAILNLMLPNGAQVKSLKITEGYNLEKIDLTNLSPGLYLIQLTTQSLEYSPISGQVS